MLRSEWVRTGVSPTAKKAPLLVRTSSALPAPVSLSTTSLFSSRGRACRGSAPYHTSQRPASNWRPALTYLALEIETLKPLQCRMQSFQKAAQKCVIVPVFMSCDEAGRAHVWRYIRQR